MAYCLKVTENQQKVLDILSQPLTPFLTAEEIVLELNSGTEKCKFYNTHSICGSLGGLRKRRLLFLKRTLRKDLKQEWIPAKAAGMPEVGGMVLVYRRQNHWCLPENVPVARGIIKHRKKEIERKENESRSA